MWKRFWFDDRRELLFCGHISFRARLKIGRCVCFLTQKFISNIIFNFLEKLPCFVNMALKKSVIALNLWQRTKNEVKGNRVDIQGPQRIYFNILSSTHFSVALNWGKSFQKKWEAAALTSRNSICEYLFLFSPEDRPSESKIKATQNQDDVC